MTTSARTRYYLNALGIPQWQARYAAPLETLDAAASAADTASHRDHDVMPQIAAQPQALAPETAELKLASADDVRLRLQHLAAEVAVCSQCELHKNRQQAVFGVGNPLADWMIIGEAPGAEEDRLGQPFVGRAGKLLDKMLLAINLDRQSAYIANIIKCRPSNNRDPHAEEINQCLGYLQQQIAIIRPKMILLVGRIAAQTLLQSNQPIGKLRGRVYNYQAQNIPMVATYHPAYLLRSPSEKHKSWQDLLLAKASYQSS